MAEVLIHDAQGVLELIDSHAHVYAEEFDSDFDEMLARAAGAGVRTMVMPSVDRDSFAPMMHRLRAHPDRLVAAIGLHPTSVRQDYLEQLAFVQEHVANAPFVAIGEIGLDYYWDTTYRAEQMDALEIQLRMAAARTLPVILHTRDAFEDMFACLDRTLSPGQTGVFHSFTGTPEEMMRALDFDGFMLGLGGVVTFRNSSLREYVGRIPLDRVLLETDAPYLSPVPHRGRRNEPAYLKYTLEHLAPLWGLSTEELAHITSANARRLFGLRPPALT